MRTQHEKKEEGTISMCLIGGLFIVGKLIGGNKIVDPRVVTLFEEPMRDSSGKVVPGLDGRPVMTPKMRMSPLHGNPPYIISNRLSLVYPVPEHDKNTLDLYQRVTMVQPASEEK